MLTIHDLEIHATHACNLSCDGCSHYSDQRQRGMVSLDTAEAWLTPWHRRLQPRFFSIVGGEPTIHPQLPEFVRLCGRLWPQSELQLVSNGFFLHRHPDLPQALRDTRGKLIISIHGQGPKWDQHRAKLDTLLAESYQGVSVEVRPFSRIWIRHYQGSGPDMVPYSDGRPRRSWRRCIAKHCMQVFRGKLWKCPQLAYLHALPFQLRPEWEPYLAYQPLPPSASDAELQEFVKRGPEPACGMCPANPVSYQIGESWT